jgi:hypothetical protein
MKKVEISENLIYVTDKSFQFGLDDDKQRQFGILFEIVNMDDATGEPEFEQYPYIVSAGIIADKCHKSFNEPDNAKPSKESLIFDTNGYMGTIPVDHILTHAIKSGSEASTSSKQSNFDLVADQFKLNEATIITSKHDYGTIAAQQGKGTEHQYLQFKTEESAQKFIDYLIKHRISALSMMIGFILDRPINMMGNDGWSVLTDMVKGK